MQNRVEPGGASVAFPGVIASKEATTCKHDAFSNIGSVMANGLFIVPL
jgi:hypothetical protein